MVYRSAITLKLLTYASGGSIVAAATGGLPEQVGGERNWDYRYTWVRDGSFSVRALLALGFRDEAIAFSMWMRDRAEEKREDGSHARSTSCTGSMGARTSSRRPSTTSTGTAAPGRCGSATAPREQLQLDIYGEFLDSLYLLDQARLHGRRCRVDRLAEIIDWLCENWDQPDEGVWETRGGRKPFVYGRLMCWVAFDRAIRIARNRSLPAVARSLDDRARPHLPRHP